MSNLVKDFDFVLDLAKFDESVEDLGDVVKGAPQSVRRRWRRPSLRGPFDQDVHEPKGGQGDGGEPVREGV